MADANHRDDHRLPVPERGAEAALAFVVEHLSDLVGDEAAPSPLIRGGQAAADAALQRLDVRGYASRRNEVWPPERRGSSMLSPYIRHGLLTLDRVWQRVEGGPRKDVGKFRSELQWQEYARHLYARLGSRLRKPIRAAPRRSAGNTEGWPRSMACLDLVLQMLEREGWIPNQSRMWMASHWTVRSGCDWRQGEEHFFRHLLDGSRAANRLGWHWTIGSATGKPYGLQRRQVEHRAPGLCAECTLATTCPIEAWPATGLERVEAPPELYADPEPEVTRGPSEPQRQGVPREVWLTAESLGTRDPARHANPNLPCVFVFDAPLLAMLRLSRKRLVFLVETLAELASDRPLEIWRGTPGRILAGRPLAVTFSPVPGWRRLAAALRIQELHPWPWLRTPGSGSLQSYSKWLETAAPPNLGQLELTLS
jgi:deoxyribodipyrimidine photo-lyase